jgi:YHS domain-containing protein
MKRLMFWTLFLVASLYAPGYTATSEPQAESPVKAADCLADGDGDAVASTDYGGKTYYFRSQACKDEFLTDPERFSQLYDALLELRAQGKPLQKPKPLDDASMVPS